MKASKSKLAVLTICSFLTSIAPLLITFIVRWELYTKDVSGAIKLTFGGIFVVLLLLLTAIGKMKIPGRLIFLSILFVMSYLLQAVMRDIALLSGMTLLGAALDNIFFKSPIATMREQLLIDRTADATAQRVASMVTKGGGRI